MVSRLEVNWFMVIKFGKASKLLEFKLAFSAQILLSSVSKGRGLFNGSQIEMCIGVGVKGVLFGK